ncbi:hypothetical protein SLE2022_379520 [Rubroshorea leprosula]
MITSSFTHFLLLFLVHLFSNEFISLQASGFASHSTNFTTTCWEMERNALLKFKEGLNDPAGRLSSWVGNYCCTWSGVGCNRQTGHVTKLDLRMPLANSFNSFNMDPETFGFASLQGTISPSLLDLKYLHYLDLSWNYFEQTPIPNFIGSFTKLEYLNLSCAFFRGLVPPHLGNLSNLRYLDLSSWDQDALVSDLNWILGLSSLRLLDLSQANLSFASTNWLPAINMLPSLMELHLSNCSLHDIPTSLPIVNFSSIQVIDLSQNDFNSPLPGWLFNISSLAVLDLSYNDFSGQIAPYLENLNNMSVLVLGHNDLSGPLPISIGNLSSLEILYLSFNQLNGPLPISIGNLSSLEILCLSSNQLNGTIPETIGQLKVLSVLDLTVNNWEGVVSRIHFLHLNNMESFFLTSVNEKPLKFAVGYDWIPPFSLSEILIGNCQMNPKFPIWLQTQKELQVVHLTNVGISSYVPDWFWKLSPQLRFLSLNANNLSGELPRSLKFRSDSSVDLSSNLFEGPIPLFSGVGQLNLQNNSLSGPIPANLADAMPNLEYLVLSENHFNGSIPSSINKLEHLTLLLLENNELSGKIPSMNRLNKLQTLDLSNNNLFGNIPSSLCSQSPLSYLKLNGNNLYGNLSSLKNCRELGTLGLANNQLHGVIPRWIGETLSGLSILQLRGNMFRGKIPKSLCSLPFLHVMDLGQNNLSGSIPPCPGNLSRLYHPQNGTIGSSARLFGIAIFTVRKGTSVEVKLPVFEKFPAVEFNVKGQTLEFSTVMEFNVKGQTLEFFKIVNLVNLIDLSGNNLEGEIPKEIVKLSALGTLNLSRNQLTGNIPEKIGDLRLLETLDLSVNHLLGPIPASMSSMTFLSHLNLSYNDLSGPIPSANQFLTFIDPSIYEGNPKLCGAPLPTNCSTHKNDTPEGYTGKDRDEIWSERLWFYIGTASGFVVGFWAVCGTLVIKRSWRNAYFRFVEEMKDRIYVFIVVKVACLQKKLKGSERS